MAYANKRMEEYPNMEEGSGYIMWKRFKDAYRDGETVREAEMTQEMAELNEEWRENLAIQRAMLIDKACEYFADWMRRHNDYAQFAVDGLRKAMEE